MAFGIRTQAARGHGRAAARFTSVRGSGPIRAMQQDRPLGIGLVGAGFIAATRARCYRALGGRAALLAVATRNPARASDFAQAHGVAGAAESFDALLARDDIDLVDLCVPNDLHRPMTEAAARAGKHVVCTKPLTAYVGQDLGDDPEAEVAATPRRRMLELAVADAEAMVAACDAAGVQLMYGENWVYAPGVVRAAGLLGRPTGRSSTCVVARVTRVRTPRTRSCGATPAAARCSAWGRTRSARCCG